MLNIAWSIISFVCRYLFNTCYKLNNSLSGVHKAKKEIATKYKNKINKHNNCFDHIQLNYFIIMLIALYYLRVLLNHKTILFITIAIVLLKFKTKNNRYIVSNLG